MLLASSSLNIDITETTHYFMDIAILGSQMDSSSFNDSLLVPYRNTYTKFVCFLWKCVEKNTS